MQEEKTKQVDEKREKSVSIGALLVNGRNAASLSQVDISEQLNLPLRTIQALEKDKFDELPEATYIRGYLRNYARTVGVNAEYLVDAFDQQHVEEVIEVSPTKSKQSYDPAILWSTAAVFSILMGLVITWWIESNPDIKLTADEQIASITVTSQSHKNALKEESNLSDSQLEVEEQEIAPTLDVEPDQGKLENSDAQIALEMQQAIQESDGSNMITLNDSAHVLTVTYMQESWTEIRDADENTLMQGLIEPGVVRNLSGKPPFEIFLGNAPGVVIEVNGLYFDHSQYSRSNRTARFQVSSGSLN